MDCDWSVELGADDPVLEFPWTDSNGKVTYIDLRTSPERVTDIPEASDVPELARALVALNAPSSPFVTAKCDVWTDDDLTPEEELLGRTKFAGYIDVLFNHAGRFDFAAHEGFVKAVATCVEAPADLPATAELIVRRCFYHPQPLPASDNYILTPGFFVTAYVTGYGSDSGQARQHWAAALDEVVATIGQQRL